MTDHPYRDLPESAFWSRAVRDVAAAEIDPVVGFGLTIRPEMRVATAGSCFAQHIARHLQSSGFNYYVAETAHPLVPPAIAQANNYGLFSARYGNVYTARQLLQLFRRAHGSFLPDEDAWIEADGCVLDPFRPTTQPDGFASLAEMHSDRAHHLAAVREMFATLDVFVFTLGLTECWRATRDGAVFPVCPGVSGGRFDPDRYAFYNQSVDDVAGDLSLFLEGLRAVNPRAAVLLTVSPVPLAATAAPAGHVLTATTYSKSVLRVAAEMVAQAHDHVHYFPSYEIITSAASRGAYYAADLRNVTEAGVSHVMRLVLKHATSAEPIEATPAPAPPPQAAKPPAPDAVAAAAQWVEVLCDEEALDRPDDQDARTRSIAPAATG